MKNLETLLTALELVVDGCPAGNPCVPVAVRVEGLQVGDDLPPGEVAGAPRLDEVLEGRL